MSEFVKCGRCGTVYDMHGTHGTTVVNGYCPMCGLHHSGTHSIAYPVLKPSPLAAKPINREESERMSEYITEFFGSSSGGSYTERREPIVRCRDCAKLKGILPDPETGETKPCCTMFGFLVGSDGFCAWGEKVVYPKCRS